jgi:hypothetical protein
MQLHVDDWLSYAASNLRVCDKFGLSTGILAEDMIDRHDVALS